MERFGTYAPRAHSLILRLINKIHPDIFTPVNWSARTPSAFWFQCISVTLVGGAARELFLLWHRCCAGHR